MELGKPAHKVLRREPTGVASILAACFEKVDKSRNILLTVFAMVP